MEIVALPLLVTSNTPDVVPHVVSAGDEVKPRRESGPPEGGTKPEGPGMFVATPVPLPELPGNGPAIIVTAEYTGAHADVVAQVVAGPIDAQLNGLEGVAHRVLSYTSAAPKRAATV